MKDSANSLKRLYFTLLGIGATGVITGWTLFFTDHWQGFIVALAGTVVAISSIMFTPTD